MKHRVSATVEIEDFVRWGIECPAVARIEPLSHHPEQVAALVTSIASIAESGSKLSESGLAGGWLQDFRRLEAGRKVEELARMWKEDPVLKNGYFMVEYAPGTSMLSITYLPPFPDGQAGGGPRYTKSLSSPTVSMLGDTGVGTLHVDLTEADHMTHVNEQDRARSIVDQLQNRGWFANSLNHNSQNLQGTRTGPSGYAFPYELVPEGGTISGTAYAAAPVKLQPFAAPDPSEIMSLPRALVENLAAVLLDCTCYSNRLIESESTFVLGDFIVKKYPCPPPPPPPVQPQQAAGQ